MIRSTWKFMFQAQEVYDAVNDRINYHMQHRAHYSQEVAQAEVDLRGSVEFREHQVTGGTNTTLVVDTEKQTWLNFAKARLTHHRNKVVEYLAWAKLLQNKPDKNLKLDVADYEYFFISPVDELFTQEDATN